MNQSPTDQRRAGVGWLLAGLGFGALAAIGLVMLGKALLSPNLPTAMAPPVFVEESAAAGIDHVYDGEFNFFVGGGVAVFDCDDDNKPDLYIAGGINPASLYRNDSAIGGRLQFSRVTTQETDLGSVIGAYPLDVDGDGYTDLAVLRFGENMMLRGLGGCRFERANETWGIDGGNEWTAAFSAKWDDEAALPTLAFGNYLAENGQQTGECANHVLFRPTGSVYGPSTPLNPGWCTLSILFSDWDRSGRVDLRMTNDRHYYREGEEQLWRVAENEPPHLYTHEEGWQRMQIWGMGIASQDLTGDGLPEVFLTSQGDNKLQTLVEGASQPTYEDVAFERGVTAHRPFVGDESLPSTAWHAEFEDVNNDALMDLFISKGNVEAQPDYAARDPSNLLLGSPDGSFTEAAGASGIVSFARARGAAVADLNLDGMLDLVSVNRRENVKLWRNVGWGSPGQPRPMGNWIAVRLRQPGPNRDAIGSWVEVEVDDQRIERETTVGGGHAGGQLGWIHFGLGSAQTARVRVQWPDGETGPWFRVEANRYLMIDREAREPEPWIPGGS
ncbi:MAG: CRTAC1 family protein [Acidimicrobiia bacterium]